MVRYASATYAAGTWSEGQRVIARIIAGPQGIDVRYVVASFIVSERKYLYQTVYCGRGEAELFINECKLGLGSDTSPCQKATANQFRLLLQFIRHRFFFIIVANSFIFGLGFQPVHQPFENGHITVYRNVHIF